MPACITVRVQDWTGEGSRLFLALGGLATARDCHGRQNVDLPKWRPGGTRQDPARRLYAGTKSLLGSLKGPRHLFPLTCVTALAST